MENNVEAFHMSGKSHDRGDKLGYMKASNMVCVIKGRCRIHTLVKAGFAR